MLDPLLQGAEGIKPAMVQAACAAGDGRKVGEDGVWSGGLAGDRTNAGDAGAAAAACRHPRAVRRGSARRAGPGAWDGRHPGQAVARHRCRHDTRRDGGHRHHRPTDRHRHVRNADCDGDGSPREDARHTCHRARRRGAFGRRRAGQRHHRPVRRPCSLAWGWSAISRRRCCCSARGAASARSAFSGWSSR